MGRRLSKDNDWRTAAWRVAGTFGVTSMVALGVILIIETSLYLESPTRQPEIAAVDSGAVAVFLIGLIVALFTMALAPSYDILGMVRPQRPDRGGQPGDFPFTPPLQLREIENAESEWRRMAYVYAAEAVAGLLFVHLFLTTPFLFSEEMRQYWPYGVMAIAFAGVGIGELFHRSGIRVLAEPFQRTAAFLPLLPVVGVWLVSSQSEYSTLLFVVGLLYLAISILRTSWISGVVAGVAVNLALWALFKEQGLNLTQNPQFWLIPPAVSVLAAAQINRQRLSESQLSAVRYASLSVIYLSSTSEIFLRGIGQHIWPPMLLMLLALTGAFLGIALRIRAFLYVGTSFVMLAMSGMVLHASRALNHVWPLWAFGVGLGLLILILFGVFEKNRAEISRFAEQLRQWDR